MQIILVLAAMLIAVPAKAEFSYEDLANEIGWNAEMSFKYGKDDDSWAHCPHWHTRTGEKIKGRFLGFSGDNPWQPIDLYLDAYEFTRDQKFLNWAISSAEFIWNNRIVKETMIFCQYEVHPFFWTHFWEILLGGNPIAWESEGDIKPSPSDPLLLQPLLFYPA